MPVSTEKAATPIGGILNQAQGGLKIIVTHGITGVILAAIIIVITHKIAKRYEPSPGRKTK